jgi:hypothetical protein
MNEMPLIAHETSFAVTGEPTLNIRRSKLKFGAACLKELPETDYIQIAVYPASKRLCAVPVGKDDKDGIRWSSYTAKRQAKEISALDFVEKLNALMGWRNECRYKAVGKIVSETDGKKHIVFDLTAAMVYEPGEGGTISRKPKLPPEQRDIIGTPADEHNNNPLVKRFTKDTEVIFSEEQSNG